MRYWPLFRCNYLPELPLTTEIRVINHGRITLGNGASFQRRCSISAVGGEILIGNRVSFNRNCIAICHQRIRIGSNCAFGPNVVIYDHDHKFNSMGFAQDEYNTSPIEIGDNCWIGANVTILRGTIIGEGSVIGAGTVVRGVIPPHSLVTSGREMIVRPIEERNISS